MFRSMLPAALAMCFSLLLGAQSARADYILAIDAAGMESDGGFESMYNSSQTFQLSPNASIFDIRWDGVTYESYAPSRRSEVAFAFTNSDRSKFWRFNISPENSPGMVVNSSGGMDDTILSGGGPFSLNTDGILRFEVFELYVDLEASPNAHISSGTFSVTTSSTVAVPEPSLLGLALLGAPLALVRRRRR